MERTGAAAVVIGNEVLSAKVVEQNGAALIKRMRERGVTLRSLAIVPDEIDAIVEAITVARRRARYVITSGGIGPTHDDLTVRAVSLALGRPVVRSPEIEGLICQHYGSTPTPESFRMADTPQGAELLYQEGIWFPVVACDDVFMLPGVPQLFRLQLEAVLARIPGSPVCLRTLYLAFGESEIAGALDQVALSRPHLAIGSYPTFDRTAGYHVKVTIEHAERSEVDRAVEELSRVLPPGALIRTE